MNKIEEIIGQTGMSKKEVAEHLFPDHKRQDLAINRIIKGEQSLTIDQAQKLAALCGKPLSSLFVSKKNWDQGAKPGHYVISTGDWMAVLDHNTWTTRVFHKGSLYHEEVLSMSNVTVKDYLAFIELIIAKEEFKS